MSEIYDYLKEYCKGKEFKLPKKHLIRCQVRLTAKQTFNNSPWTLIDGIARQHNIVKECPANVQEIFNKHEEKKRKKLLEKQRKLEAKASKAREKALRAKEKAERQREREEKAREKANKKKNANVIDLTDSSLVNNINDNNEFENKQLKYPCDDQLLMVYKRLTDEEIDSFIKFFKSTTHLKPAHDTNFNLDNWKKCVTMTVGADKNSNSNENENNDSEMNVNDDVSSQMESNSNMVYFDFLSYLNEEGRFGRNTFDAIWDIWSFVQVYSKELGLASFPISFLIESLMYDKKCVLLEELIARLLEMIRNDCMIKFNNERAKLIKKHNSRTRRRGRVAKAKAKAKTNGDSNNNKTTRKVGTRSQTQKKDDDDDEENESNDDEDEDSDEDSEEDESSDDTSGEEDEEEEDSDVNMEISDIVIDGNNINNGNNTDVFNPQLMSHPVFNDTPIHDFKFQIFKNYLLWRCDFGKQDSDENEDDEEDDEDDKDDKIDKNGKQENDVKKENDSKNNNGIKSGKAEIDDDDENEDDDDKVMNENDNNNDNKENENGNKDDNENENENENDDEERKVLEFGYNKFDKFVLANGESILNGLSTIRRYNSLDFDSKLEVLLLLLNDSMHGETFNNYCQRQNSHHRQVLLKLQKKLDEECQSLLKSEKAKQKDVRQAISGKKKELNAFIANNSNNSNNSNESKEKEEQEREEIKKMEKQLKGMRDKMNEKLRLKEYENIRQYWKHLQFCQTQLERLGSDRFYNEYYWNQYTDGRIFIYLTNFVENYSKQQQGQEIEEKDGQDGQDGQDETVAFQSLGRNTYITPTCIPENTDERKGNESKIDEKDLIDKMAKCELMDVLDMKGCDPWIVSCMADENDMVGMKEEEMKKNKFVPVWCYISSTKEFSQLLSLLDERGHRESKLLKKLNGLKDEIITSMRNEGNDNVTVFDENASLQLYTLRRSRRTKKNKSLNEMTFRQYSAKLNI